MPRKRVFFGFGRIAKSVTAALGVALVLLLGAFAVSPSLHQRVHTDSDRPDHFCAVSAFATGQLSWTETALIVAAACVLLAGIVSLRETPFASYLDFYSSPNRAPPRL